LRSSSSLTTMPLALAVFLLSFRSLSLPKALKYVSIDDRRFYRRAAPPPLRSHCREIHFWSELSILLFSYIKTVLSGPIALSENRRFGETNRVKPTNPRPFLPGRPARDNF
jgi:hypothetical protein